MSSAALEGFTPNSKQLDLARLCVRDGVRVVLADGAIRSGKTQVAARVLVEWCTEFPATYLVGRATYRSLRDSTMKAMLWGDGALPPLIPPELVSEYRASDELVRLRSGGEILFRSLEEQDLSKILNLSLAGVLVDQIEELDGGEAGERVFDTLLGRLSDPRGPRKLVCVANPAGLTSWQYRRLVDPETRSTDVGRVHFTLADNEANLPADYVASMMGTRASRPAWFRSFVLGEWGAFTGQAFPEFSEATHVVAPFSPPDSWERFESLDHGASHPTVVLAYAVDWDGNLVVFGEYSSPGLVSRHVAELKALRQRWGTRVCWADPSVFASQGLEARFGGPASVASEYAEHGIALSRAQNDRRAGYLRLLELLHADPSRLRPTWAGPGPSEVVGAPRLYVSGSCRTLVAQLKSAPLLAEGRDAGEAVDRKWEGEHGHAVASLRYGAMSRPAPSVRPERSYDGPGEWKAFRQKQLLEGFDRLSAAGRVESVYQT